VKTAYSYIRWSTLSQGGNDRDSKTRQQQSARKWIEDYGKREYLLSDEVFLDAGKSGFKGKHLAVDEYGQAKGELRRFIQLVEQGKIKAGSILLVDDYSRFSRLAPSKSISLFMSVIDANIGLVFTGSFEKRVINTDLIDREPYILQFIVGEISRSYAESAERSRKIKEAKRTLFTNIKNGVCQRNALPPYFTFVPNAGSKSIGHYEHNKNTPIVKELASMFLQGKSLYEIAGIMNGRKIKTFKGKDWSGNGISRILANPILKGEHHGVKNFAPPIVDDETWQKIQNRLSKNVFRGQKGDVINIFRGMCFCHECGHTMNVMANYNPKDRTQQYRYLRCAMTSQKNSSCSNRGVIRLNEMEQELFFDCLMKDPAALLDNNEREEIRELNKHITNTEAKLNKITNDIKAATELIGAVTVDELKVKLSKLENERKTVTGQLDALNFQRSLIQDATHNYFDLRKLFVPSEKKHKTHEEALNDKESMDELRDRLQAIEHVIDALSDEFVREGVRVMLPSLINKITVDTRNGGSRFFVYNRTGKLIYTSLPQHSNRNNSDSWKEKVQAGIKKYWAKKKTKKGTN
jgi:Recombinase/Recombinase zinc beta ribbon domain/Resolvase, N terminal domain